MPDEPVTLFCPVCCSAIDAQSSDTEFECHACEQKWTMTVVVARIADHSPA
jgi:hypothetical protein